MKTCKVLIDRYAKARPQPIPARAPVSVLIGLFDFLHPRYCVPPSKTRGETNRMKTTVMERAPVLKAKKRGDEIIAVIRNNG